MNAYLWFIAGATFGFGTGVVLTRRAFYPKFYKPMQLLVLQMELLEYILKTFQEEDLEDDAEVDKFIRNVNERVEFINIAYAE